MTTANHVLLRRITLTASASSVTFDSIPQTGYTDLKIVASTRGDTGSFPSLRMTINGATTNYSSRRLYGDGTTAASDTPTTPTYLVQMPVPAASQTASTFASTEFYIPSYTAAVNKSVSVDSVAENNAAATYTMMNAGLWSQTTAISTIAFALSSGNLVAGSSFSLYGIADVNTTPTAAPKADGGDIIKTDGTYWYHVFTSAGSFKPQLNLTADILVLAGGGGGGGSYSWDLGAAGGGAGGLLGFTSQALTNTSYTCTIGAGGSLGTNNTGANGTNSQFGSLTACIGGGGGSGQNISAGGNGGSGGGGAPDKAAGSGTAGQGYAGGSYSYGGGGGGGATGTGVNPIGNAGGAGGPGSNSYSSWLSAVSLGVSGYIAGGGGGGGWYTSGGAGGSSAGGAGGYDQNPGISASIYTGSGGGGSGRKGTYGGNGSSGFIIIRYPV